MVILLYRPDCNLEFMYLTYYNLITLMLTLNHHINVLPIFIIIIIIIIIIINIFTGYLHLYT